MSNQAKYLQEQLEPISIALNTLHSDSTSIADSCHSWLKLTGDELLQPHKEIVQHRFKQAMTSYHFLAYCLHPKYRGRKLRDEHLRFVHQLVNSRWQEVSSYLCAFQAETNPFPLHMFEESFNEKVDPCVCGGCVSRSNLRM